ncbi:MAG: ribosome recycling factor [Candidatus Brocadiae bacterium]|nr:ribosome recycling factor [Candidatus Brocadiia bacterium]
MPIDDIILESEDKMDKAVAVLTEEFKGIRTGRATPALVDTMVVEYYGAPTPLKQVASISCPDARLIVIKPYDATALPGIEKAIQKSNLGINPQNDGKLIRLAIPPLSEERRKQMAKLAKDHAEKAKVALRNIRRDALKQGEGEQKEGLMTEDDLERFKTEIQHSISGHERKIDEQMEKKTKEIMEV